MPRGHRRGEQADGSITAGATQELLAHKPLRGQKMWVPTRRDVRGLFQGREGEEVREVQDDPVLLEGVPEKRLFET